MFLPGFAKYLFLIEIFRPYLSINVLYVEEINLFTILICILCCHLVNIIIINLIMPANNTSLL